MNDEFTPIPICTASTAYEKLKLKQIDADESISEAQRAASREDVLAKACICHDLGGGATLNHNIDPDAKTSVCCGPDIVSYSKITSLEEMVGHIYGRVSLITNSERLHMFTSELKIYVDYLRNEVEKLHSGVVAQTPKYLGEFRANLLEGIGYYRELASHFVADQRDRFTGELDALVSQLEGIAAPPATTA